MILRPLYRGQDLPTSLAVDMTEAGSGSSGITVADNANVNFNTANFTIDWQGALPDYSPATDVAVFFKYQSAANMVFVYVTAAQKLRAYAEVGGVVLINKTTAASIPATDGTTAQITISCARETITADGSVAFYTDAALLESQTITAAATVSASNTGVLDICGNSSSGARYASQTRALRLFNRALSAAEVLSLRKTGTVNAADVGATQTPVYSSDFSAGVDGWTGTSYTVAGNIDGILGVDNTLRSTCSSTGTGRRIAKTVALTLGLRYRITMNVYFPATNVSADSFLITNQAGTELATNITRKQNQPLGSWLTTTIEFVCAVAATGIRIYTGTSAGTTTTTTINDIMYIASFKLERIGCILNLEPTGIAAADLTWTDSSGNGNNGTLPASGATKVTLRK